MSKSRHSVQENLGPVLLVGPPALAGVTRLGRSLQEETDSPSQLLLSLSSDGSTGLANQV